jgi:hypothetical protein
MSPRKWTTESLVACALLVGLAGTGACSRNPAPVTPAAVIACETSRVSPPNADARRRLQPGGLSFDPQGADFTSWISTFRNAV